MKKNILFFILGAVIFSIISVYATVTYSANQITYTKGNNTMFLSEAIDELYTTQGTTVSDLNARVNSLQSKVNNYSTLYVGLTAENWSSNSAGATMFFNTFRNNYSHAKLYSKTLRSGCNSCQIYLSGSQSQLVVNQEFNINDYNYVIIYSTGAPCDTIFQIW